MITNTGVLIKCDNLELLAYLSAVVAEVYRFICTFAACVPVLHFWIILWYILREKKNNDS